jgi:hypothetical protein
MAELTNRDEVEAKLARRMAKLSAAHRRELIKLLGDPPSAANVPESFWRQVEDDVNAELTAALLIIFMQSMALHGFEGPDAVVIAEGWAAQRATEVAGQWTATSRDIVTRASERWDQIAAGEAPAGTGDELPEPITAGEVSDSTLDALGPDRVALLAENETTVAQHQGAETAVAETVGLSPDDVWVNTGSNICPTCEGLNGTVRSFWERFFPDGPPTPHPRCKCYVEYAS